VIDPAAYPRRGRPSAAPVPPRSRASGRGAVRAWRGDVASCRPVGPARDPASGGVVSPIPPAQVRGGGSAALRSVCRVDATSPSTLSDRFGFGIKRTGSGLRVPRARSLRDAPRHGAVPTVRPFRLDPKGGRRIVHDARAARGPGPQPAVVRPHGGGWRPGPPAGAGRASGVFGCAPALSRALPLPSRTAPAGTGAKASPSRSAAGHAPMPSPSSPAVRASEDRPPAGPDRVSKAPRRPPLPHRPNTSPPPDARCPSPARGARVERTGRGEASRCGRRDEGAPGVAQA